MTAPALVKITAPDPMAAVRVLNRMRAAKAIRAGVAALKLRAEIRQATYAEFEKAKDL